MHLWSVYHLQWDVSSIFWWNHHFDWYFCICLNCNVFATPKNEDDNIVLSVFLLVESCRSLSFVRNHILWNCKTFQTINWKQQIQTQNYLHYDNDKTIHYIENPLFCFLVCRSFVHSLDFSYLQLNLFGEISFWIFQIGFSLRVEVCWSYQCLSGGGWLNVIFVVEWKFVSHLFLAQTFSFSLWVEINRLGSEFLKKLIYFMPHRKFNKIYALQCLTLSALTLTSFYPSKTTYSSLHFYFCVFFSLEIRKVFAILLKLMNVRKKEVIEYLKRNRNNFFTCAHISHLKKFGK